MNKVAIHVKTPKQFMQVTGKYYIQPYNQFKVYGAKSCVDLEGKFSSVDKFMQSGYEIVEWKKWKKGGW